MGRYLQIRILGIVGLTFLLMAHDGRPVKAQESHQTEVHDFRLNAAHVFSLDQMKITSKGLSLELKDVTLIPIETPSGFTGALIMAQGEVRFTPDNARETLRDRIETVMLRFHPGDYEQVLKLGDRKPREDPATQQRAMTSLMQYYHRCYHAGLKLIFPPKDTLVAVFNGKTYGEKVLVHSDGERCVVSPPPRELQLRKEVFSVEAGQTLSRDQRWQRDLKYFTQSLDLYHTDPFTVLPKGQFEREMNSLVESVPDLSDFQIYVRLMKVVTKIGDAHTNVSTPRIPIRRYPVELYWLKDGLFVTAVSEQHEQILKSRLVKIGDTSVDDAYRAVAAVIPHENEAQLKKTSPALMQIPDLLRELGVDFDSDGHRLTVESGSGGRSSVELPPMTVSQLKQVKRVSFLDRMDEPLAWSRQPRKEFYWYRYLEDARALYCQYNACRSMPDKPIDAFTEELLEFIESHPVERFVLDIRRNSGGSSPLLEPLIAGLRKSKVNARGKLFCLTGRRTFSSAVLNAITLRRSTEAIFIGEPTGGKPNHFGEVREFTLPYSKLQVSYSTKHFQYSDQDSPSFLPDIVLEVSSDDYFAGRDPVLREALIYAPANQVHPN